VSVKTKSYLGFILVLCVILVVSACSSSNNKNNASSAPSPSSPSNAAGSNEKVSLKLWYWNGAISDSVIEAARQKFPNVELNAEKLPSGGDYLTKLKTTISGGGSGPDIVAMDSWVASMLEYKEKFVNLYDHGARDIQSQYLDWKWKMAADAKDEYLIGLPIDVAPVVLYYRGDVYEQAGLSSAPEDVKGQIATWEDFFELLKKVKDSTGTQTMTLVDVFRSIIGQNSEGFFDLEGNYIGDQEHIKRAWDLSVKAYQEGLTFPASNDSEINASLNNGAITSMIGASWVVGDLLGAAPDTNGKWKIAYPPGGVGNQGGSFFGVLKSTKYPQEAYDVLKFLLGPDNQIASYKEFGNYPSTPEIYDSPDMVNEHEFFGGQDLSAVFADAAKDVQIPHTNANDDMVGNSLVESLKLVDVQKQDSEKAWTSAQDKIKRQLSR
jgi:ABC-type sugar transport system, periplasmic component